VKTGIHQWAHGGKELQRNEISPKHSNFFLHCGVHSPICMHFAHHTHNYEQYENVYTHNHTTNKLYRAHTL